MAISPRAYLFGTIVIAFMVTAGAWLWMKAPLLRSGRKPIVANFITTTPVDSHRPLSSVASSGTEIVMPPDPTLGEVLASNSSLSYSRRVAVIRKIAPASLKPAQVDFLRTYVVDPAPQQNLSSGEALALKNEVLVLLCKYPGGEVVTASLLHDLYTDKNANTDLRDYALQHLAGLVERNPAIGWSTHWLAIDGSNPAHAATALIHLSGLQRVGSLSVTDHQRLEKAALKLATDPAVPASSRATALLVCARLKSATACSLAMGLAQSTDAAVPLRIAAIAALGDLAKDAESRKLLMALAEDPEIRLHIPAKAALKKLSFD